MAIKYPPTRVTTNFALCGLVLLIISTCKSQLTSEEHRSRFTRHMEAIRQFPCRDPQPRSISVQDLLRGQIETSEIVQPHITVLHRCDNGTGCCSKTSEACAMEFEEDVELHFFIRDELRGLRPHFKEFKVKNHTLCSCQSIRNPIK